MKSVWGYFAALIQLRWAKAISVVSRAFVRYLQLFVVGTLCNFLCVAGGQAEVIIGSKWLFVVFLAFGIYFI